MKEMELRTLAKAWKLRTDAQTQTKPCSPVLPCSSAAVKK